MENQEYYQALAQKIFFKGAEAGEFSSFARYRPGKNSKDLGQAIAGGLDGFDGSPQWRLGFVGY